MLSRRNYSEQELREKLSGYASAQEIDEILQVCRQKDYLNDSRLAEFLVEKYLKKAKGYLYISSILEKRGISRDVIDRIKQDLDYNLEFRVAEHFFLKNRKKKKLSSLLFSLKNRGFSFRTINKLIRTYGKKLNGQQNNQDVVSELLQE